MGLLLSNVLLSLGLLLAFYLIGNLILISFRTGKTSSFSNCFFALLTGMLATIVLYALWVTKFQTLYLALIPVIMWGISIKPEPQKRLLWKDIFLQLPQFFLVSGIFISCTVGLFCYKYMGITESFPTIPQISNDYIFYANVAAHLNKGGYENFYFQSDFPSINLYHYTEIWLTALINCIYSGPYLNSLILSAYPIFFTVSLIGFVALGESLVPGKSKIYYILAGSACLVLSPLSELVNVFSGILKGDVYALLFTHSYKLSVITIFILAIFLVRNNINAMLFFCMLLMIFYQTLMPAITGFLFLYFIYSLIKNRKFEKSDVKAIAALAAFYIIIIALLITNRIEANETHEFTLYDIYIVNIPFYLKSMINIIGSSFLKFIISCLPYLLIGALIYKRKLLEFKFLFIILLVIQTIGLLSWALLLQNPDSVQLWSNFYCPAVNVVIFSLLLISFNDNRKWVKAFSILLLCVNVYIHNPVKKFYHAETLGEKKVIETVQKHADAKIAYIRHPDEFINVYFKNTNFAIPANYLPFYLNTYTPVCINSADIPFNGYWDQLNYKNTPFTTYSRNNPDSIAKQQLDFIKKNKIKFIVATNKAEIPDFLNTMTDSTIIDSFNQIKLLVLKSE